MDDVITEQRVNCSRCRFRFAVQVSAALDWRVEAQCPCCDIWACFTIDDTRDPPRPKADDLDAEAQKLGELLWRPINAHRSHPAVAWIDRVGNGGFEDDYSAKPWPIPTFWVYRFTRGTQAGYIWQEGDSWFVRTWHPLRGRRKPPEVSEVFSFEAALDKLSPHQGNCSSSGEKC